MKSKFLLLSLALLLLAGCKKEEVQLGSVYGTVNEKVTGNAIANVSVELIKSDEKSGESVTTDDDGSFEFRNLEEGVYNLLFSKPGYESLKKEGIVVKGGGNSKPVFVLMEKLPGAVTIVDDNKKEISEIDFGEDEGVTMRSFNIFNNSEETLDWEIKYESDWIDSFSEKDGTLRPNVTRPITVKINRNLLHEGENTTIIHIISSNNGSRQLDD